MGVITDILVGIPLTVVLRERLVDKESYIAVLEAENAVLKAENAQLRAELQQIKSDKAVHEDICPYCQQPNGKLLDIQPDKMFGQLGVKIRYYQCQNCGKEYDKEQTPEQ